MTAEFYYLRESFDKYFSGEIGSQRVFRPKYFVKMASKEAKYIEEKKILGITILVNG